MRPRRIILTVATSAALGVAGTPAVAALPSTDALATAISAQPGLVTGAAYVTTPPFGASALVSTTRRVGYPRHGGSYAILSTGDTGNLFGVSSPNLSTDLGGSNVAGDTDLDVTVVRIDMLVPTGRNCLSIDTRFLSEEFPEFPGKVYNDAVLMELDVNDWTTVGSRVIAPHNFALRTNTINGDGFPLNIRTTGDTSANFANARGTRFDGATPMFRITTPIKPGAHSLYISLFDQGDQLYDSAAFMDRLRTYASKRPCPIGAAPIIKPAVLPRATVTRSGRRVYRATVSSESGLSYVIARLDGRTVRFRRSISTTTRRLVVNVPVAGRGTHRLVVAASNRAGTTRLVRTIGG